MLTLNILHDKLTIQKLNRNQKSFQLTVQEIVQIRDHNTIHQNV